MEGDILPDYQLKLKTWDQKILKESRFLNKWWLRLWCSRGYWRLRAWYMDWISLTSYSWQGCNPIWKVRSLLLGDYEMKDFLMVDQGCLLTITLTNRQCGGLLWKPELREAIGSLIQPMLVYFTMVFRSRTERSYWQPYPTHACLLHRGIQVQNWEKLLAVLSNPWLFTSPWYPGPELREAIGSLIQPMLVYFTLVSRSRTERSYWQSYPTHDCLLHRGIQVQNWEKLLAALSNPCLFTSPWYSGPELREATGSLIQPMIVYFTVVFRSRTERSYWQPYPTHACLLHHGIQVQNSEKLLAALSNPCLFTSPWYLGPELREAIGSLIQPMLVYFTLVSRSRTEMQTWDDVPSASQTPLPILIERT